MEDMKRRGGPDQEPNNKPKLVKKRVETPITKESAAKKWMSKTSTAAKPGQPKKWATAQTRTQAVNAFSGGKPSLASKSLSGANTGLGGKPGFGPKPGGLGASRPGGLGTPKPGGLGGPKPGLGGPAKANWQKAALKSKAVNGLGRPAGPGFGAKKPYVPYKPQPKPGSSSVGGKGGMGGAKGGPKFGGGGRMGGRLF